jgi:hypothetical protein
MDRYAVDGVTVYGVRCIYEARRKKGVKISLLITVYYYMKWVIMLQSGKKYGYHHYYVEVGAYIDFSFLHVLIIFRRYVQYHEDRTMTLI